MHQGSRIAGWIIVGLSTGCSVRGTWERIRTDPPNVAFPVDELVLNEDRTYSARWKSRGSERTSRGTYRHTFGKLMITQQGRKPRTYDVRRRLDGTLELRYTVGDRTATAILQRKPATRRQKVKPSTPADLDAAGTPGSNTGAADTEPGGADPSE